MSKKISKAMLASVTALALTAGLAEANSASADEVNESDQVSVLQSEGKESKETNEDTLPLDKEGYYVVTKEKEKVVEEEAAPTEEVAEEVAVEEVAAEEVAVEETVVEEEVAVEETVVEEDVAAEEDVAVEEVAVEEEVVAEEAVVEEVAEEVVEDVVEEEVVAEEAVVEEVAEEVVEDVVEEEVVAEEVAPVEEVTAVEETVVEEEVVAEEVAVEEEVVAEEVAVEDVAPVEEAVAEEAAPVEEAVVEEEVAPVEVKDNVVNMSGAKQVNVTESASGKDVNTVVGEQSDIDEQHLDWVNQHRYNNGVGALVIDEKLQEFSNWKAKYISENYTLADIIGQDNPHDLPGIGDLSAQYEFYFGKSHTSDGYLALGENLQVHTGEDNKTKSTVRSFNSWMNSQVHNDNMAAGVYDSVG